MIEVCWSEPGFLSTALDRTINNIWLVSDSHEDHKQAGEKKKGESDPLPVDAQAQGRIQCCWCVLTDGDLDECQERWLRDEIVNCWL